MVLKSSIAIVALLWNYQISRPYERVKLSGCLHEGRKRSQTSLRFQYALNYQTCSWSFFSSYLHNSPIKRYQSLLNLKPVCRISVRFHPVLRLLLRHAYFFDSVFDMYRNLIHIRIWKIGILEWSEAAIQRCS